MLTYAILFATALVDVVLYLVVPNGLMCYPFGARQYRGAPGSDSHEPFQLETHGALPATDSPAGRSSTNVSLRRSDRHGLPRSSESPLTADDGPGAATHSRRSAGLTRGEVRCDDVFVQLYASDASIYQIRPWARSCTAQHGRRRGLRALRRREANRLATPWRRDRAGRRIARPRIDPRFQPLHAAASIRTEEGWVRIQPGMVHAQLNESLRTRGRQFGPDPSTSLVTTMGSVVAIDVSGSHFGRMAYGSTRRPHVQSLQAVLADGTLLEVGREPIPTDVPTPISGGGIGGRLAELLLRHAPLHRPAAAEHAAEPLWLSVGRRAGNQCVHLGKLLTGSEGTLAIITEATLGTVPLPPATGESPLCSSIRWKRRRTPYRKFCSSIPARSICWTGDIGACARQLFRIFAARAGRGRGPAAG